MMILNHDTNVNANSALQSFTNQSFIYIMFIYFHIFYDIKYMLQNISKIFNIDNNKRCFLSIKSLYLKDF